MKRGAEKQLTQDDPEAEGDDMNNVGLSYIEILKPLNSYVVQRRSQFGVQKSKRFYTLSKKVSFHIIIRVYVSNILKRIRGIPKRLQAPAHQPQAVSSNPI